MIEAGGQETGRETGGRETDLIIALIVDSPKRAVVPARPGTAQARAGLRNSDYEISGHGTRLAPRPEPFERQTPTMPHTESRPRRSARLHATSTRALVTVLVATLPLGAMACEEEKAAPAAQPSAKPAPPPAAPTTAEAPAPTPPAKPKRTKEDCPPGPTVEITNPALEAQIRLKLQKADGAITSADLRKLKSLNATSAKLQELDVCVFSHMTGLKELFLGPGEYEDLSPIAGATGLETLRASLSKVSDLSPLAKMTKLDRIDLGHTQVKDLSPIAGATVLTELVIDNTLVEDVTPLAKMTKLETLSIKNSRVKDVSALKDLKLKALYVVGAPVEDDPSAFAAIRAKGTRVVIQ
jgi:hypothetical protein